MIQRDFDNPYASQEADYYDAEYEDLGGPSAGLVSYPASVQNQLSQLDGFMRQGRMASALEALQGAAGHELARASPEMFTFTGAMAMGHRGIMLQDMEIDRTVIETEHRMFGFRIGSSVTITTRTLQRRRGYGAY